MITPLLRTTGKHTYFPASMPSHVDESLIRILSLDIPAFSYRLIKFLAFFIIASLSNDNLKNHIFSLKTMTYEPPYNHVRFCYLFTSNKGSEKPAQMPGVWKYNNRLVPPGPISLDISIYLSLDKYKESQCNSVFLVLLTVRDCSLFKCQGRGGGGAEISNHHPNFG